MRFAAFPPNLSDLPLDKQSGHLAGSPPHLDSFCSLTRQGIAVLALPSYSRQSQLLISLRNFLAFSYAS